MESWLASFEIVFPASTVDELLLALVVRDLIYGTSFDVETEETGEQFQVDVTASDEVHGEKYQLFVEAEISGTENKELAGEFLEQVFEEAVGEAEGLIAARRVLGVHAESEIDFRSVAEDDERWDLVIPDWLAPEGAEVPFGFRSYLSATGAACPSNEDLDDAGRVVVIPNHGEFHFFAIPAPDTGESCSDD